MADQAAAAAKPERSYTGTVVSVDPNERVFSVKEWALSKKKFNLGDNCTYAMLFTPVEKTIRHGNDMRPGEKITVGYQDSHGVLIADRIEQQPVRFAGMVATIDPGKHALTLHRPGLGQEIDDRGRLHRHAPQ